MESYVKTSRAVILNDKKDGIISIKRTKYKNGKVYATYYTFPGGHVENGEKFEETVVREVHEELGINVKIIKEIKSIINNELNRQEKFFFCENIGGKIHEGDGPEFTNINYEKYGKFEIVEIKISQINKYNLLPIEIKNELKNYII